MRDHTHDGRTPCPIGPRCAGDETPWSDAIMDKPKTMQVDGIEVTLTQTEPGRPYEHRTRYGEKKMIQIDRKWIVEYEGKRIGVIEYCLITREVAPKRSRIVTRRWKSPGWRTASGEATHARFEAFSRKDAIERIVRDFKWDTNWSA